MADSSVNPAALEMSLPGFDALSEAHRCVSHMRAVADLVRTLTEAPEGGMVEQLDLDSLRDAMDCIVLTGRRADSLLQQINVAKPAARETSTITPPATKRKTDA